MKTLFSVLIQLLPLVIFCQQTHEEAERIFDSGAANEETDELETDDLRQKLHWFSNHKVNINQVDAAFLINEMHIPILAAGQLIIYRRLAGPLIDILELQAVPGWDPDLVREIIPYITVSEGISLLPTLQNRVRKGRHLIQVRTGWVGERQNAYMHDSTGESEFNGTRIKTMLRYHFRAGPLLQWGLTADKDAGEKIATGRHSMGFDFYSWYLSIGSVGMLKSLVIGDFNISMGQGLIHWQSPGAIGKNAETILVLRQGYQLRAHGGTDEHRFHRGIAAGFVLNKFHFLLFVARDRWDGRVVSDSSASELSIRSLQSSGLHRTRSEIQNKNAVALFAGGGQFSFNYRHSKLSLNIIHYKFSHALKSEPSPENLFDMRGNNWTNLSIDYRANFRSLYLFGELAADRGYSFAAVAGCIAAVHPRINFSALARVIQPSYRAFQAKAFTEQSEPENEQGFYLGTSISPTQRLRISAYADVFRFPWLRARVSIPSSGASHFIDFIWKPDKRHEFVVRIQSEHKMENQTGTDLLVEKLVARVNRIHLRVQGKFMGRNAEFVSRFQFSRVRKEPGGSEHGMLFYCDYFYRPQFKKMSIATRLTRFFSTYNSRLYTTERDVRNYHQLTMLDGNGWRISLLINYKILKYLLFSVKSSLNYYIDKQAVGTGPTESNRSYQSEYRLQVLYFF